MAQIPPEGSRARLFLGGGVPRVIDCEIGKDVGGGKVTILPKGRGDAHWEAIAWALVYSLHLLDSEWALIEREPELPMEGE